MPLPDDEAARGWASHIHYALAAYQHESASMRAQPSPRAPREPISPQPSPSVPPDSVKPFTRRMYDPVRDSVASSSPAASPSHTAPSVRPSDDRKPFVTSQDLHPYVPIDHVGAPSRAALHGEDDVHDRARIPRELPRRYDSPRPADRIPWLDSQVSGSDRPDGPSELPETGSEVGTAIQERPEAGPSSSKRSYGEMGDDYYRSSKVARESANVDTKGKGKAVVSQSPALRIDHLLEPNSHEYSKPPPSDDGHERFPSESRTVEHAANEYVFTGTLPPPPPTTAGSSTHTSMSHLEISVSKEVNLDHFATPDEFEKAIFAQDGPVSNALRSAIPGLSLGSEPSNLKRARKHGPTSQRRKARGLFPSDNVPLAISTSTSKQSRYRPSGDRQPVACGYKDPITQIQCDEPFNRSVELRRHVRAVHVPAEALAVTMGQLSRSQATLLPADWKPGDGDVLRPKCLCGKEFSRLDALRRHWTGVQAEVKDGKCISCPSSLGKKKDHAAFEQQGTEGAYGPSLYS